MSVPPAIDRDQLRARCLDDREFIGQMLAVFREFAPQTLSRLRQSTESMALGDARRYGHTLKGSAANLAAAGLAAVAANAEAAATAGDAAALRVAVDAAESLMGQCLVEVEAILGELERHGPAPTRR
jgi:HPt (histidine-containing phosphotransfer) domain-containing protein